MSPRPPDRTRLRLAARLFVLGVWTALCGSGAVLFAARAAPLVEAAAVPGAAGFLLAWIRTLSRAAMATALLGGALATVGGAALLAAIR